LQEAEGFRGKVSVEAPIGVHLHLQNDNRPLFAAAGVLARPQHTIGMVDHLFECDRPKGVGRVGIRITWLASGQPGQEVTHQVGQGPEHLGLPVIAWQRGLEGWRRKGRVPQRFRATTCHRLSPPVFQRRSEEVPQRGRAEAVDSMTFHVNTARLSRAGDEWQVEVSNQ
jgi:hypothetical protein